MCGTTDMPLQFFFRRKDLHRANPPAGKTYPQYSGAAKDREHNSFAEYHNSGIVVRRVGDYDGERLLLGTEVLLGEILGELQRIRLGIELLTDQPLRKEDAA